MKLIFVFSLLISALVTPTLADSITLTFTNLSITNPTGQTVTGNVMGTDLVASSGPLMIKTPTSSLSVTLGQKNFDTVWFLIAPNTSLSSLDGYKFSFAALADGKQIGTINATLAVRQDGVAIASIVNPALFFQGLDQFLQLSFTISPNPLGIGSGNYDLQATLSAVPEPSTYALLGLGLLFGAYHLRRRERFNA